MLDVNATGTADHLLGASAGSRTLATTVQTVLTRAEATDRRTLTATDAVPSQSSDVGAVPGFYVVLGSVLAGYLLAASLSNARGARLTTFRRTQQQLAARELTQPPHHPGERRCGSRRDPGVWRGRQRARNSSPRV